MTIRPFRPSDRAALMAIHQRQAIHDGLPYLFVDPCDPQQFATVVAVEDGHIVAAASGRKIAEGSTLLDPSFGGRGSDGPVRRWTLLRDLIRHSARVAYEKGYTELMAATAPNWRGYGNRLVGELGFTRDLRSRYYMDLHARFGRG